MHFKGDRAIYLQIADHIMENILTKKWKAKDRIPSVRDMAVTSEVNPNTVANSYSYLQDRGIIYNQRGVGYFVAEGADESIRQIERDNFLSEQLPEVFRRMRLLGIDFKELKLKYEKYTEAAQSSTEDADENQ